MKASTLRFLRSNAMFPTLMMPAMVLLLAVLILPSSASAEGEGSKTCGCSTLLGPAVASGDPGDILGFTASVATEGNCGSNPGTAYTFSVDPGLSIEAITGNLIDVEITPSAPSASQVTAQARLLFTPSGTVQCLADSSTLYNNQAQQPNLDVQPIGLTPAAPTAGDTVTVDAAVLNEGNASSNSYVTSFAVNGAQLSTQSCPSGQAPGQSCNASFSWLASLGSHQLTICADINNEINEGDESDNCETRNVTVDSSPDADLLIESLTVTPATPLVDQAATFTVVVRNDGPGTAGPSTTRALIDLQPYYLGCPSLSPGDTCTTAFPWTPTEPGSTSLWATADYHRLVDETNEANNRDNILVTVQLPSPDLHFPVGSIGMSPSAPTVGDDITFYLSMENRGAALGSSSSFDVIVGGQTHSFLCVSPLGTGQTCNKTLTIQATQAGPQQIQVVADPLDAIAEFHEGNNTRVQTYVVEGGGSNVSCQGTWTLTGINGNPHTVSDAGSVLDGCYVYFSANTPNGCWQTQGTGGTSASWHVATGDICPSSVTVTDSEGGVFEYSVSIY